MSARDLIIDFINYAFLLLLTGFCITYFVIGDRFAMFGEFLKMVLPISLFGIFFLIKLKFKRKIINKIADGKERNEIIGYFSREDKFKDNIIVTALPFIVLLISFFEKNLDFIDLTQALLAYLYVRLWHNYLFRAEEESSQTIYLRRSDKEKDEIAIYFLPVFICGIAMIKSELNMIIDFVQALTCFVLMISWHYVLFQEKNC